MNEQQRKENLHIQQKDSPDKTVTHEKPLYEKTSADFAKYFETTYEPPNINKARKRGRDEIEVHYDFDIAEDMRNIGQDKKRSEERRVGKERRKRRAQASESTKKRREMMT